ncbi:MAG: hypothetical protein LBU66_01625 [Treponema sp.]|nr:hypothetical protein [Treponema sp.]
MKKTCLVFVLFALFGFSVFSLSDEKEKEDFLLFQSDNGNHLTSAELHVFHSGNITNKTNGNKGIIIHKNVKGGLYYLIPWILLIGLITALIICLVKCCKKAYNESSGSNALKTENKIIVYLDDEIHRRAHLLYKKRGGQSEDAVSDWNQAVFDVCNLFKATGFKTYIEDGYWWACKIIGKNKTE